MVEKMDDEEKRIIESKIKKYLDRENRVVYNVNERNFEDLVIEMSNKIPVIVDFWAEWCYPCKMLSPVIEKVVKKFNGKVILAKVNVDENPNLAMEYNIMSIPTVLMFKNGNIVDYFVGFIPEDQIEKWIEKNLG
ncbi:MAG: thioredoxin [Candidatus Aenigmatarchaeota archaeon]